MIDKNTIPGHWDIKKIEDVCRKVSLNKIKTRQKEYLSQGLFPVVDQGIELIGGYSNEPKFIIPEEPPYIIFGDHTKIKKFINFKFIAGADGVKVLKSFPNIDPKFLYYSLHIVKIPDKGYARHFQFLEKEEIPVPPLPEQYQIVSKIEELFSELDKGKQQLETVKQQLKTYRQSVLKWAFEGRFTSTIGTGRDLSRHDQNKSQLPEGWKIGTIIELAENNKNALKAGPFGSSLKKEFYVESGYKIYGQEQVISGNAFLGDYYVTREKFEELKSNKVKPNDVLISLVGTVGKVLILPENCQEGIINPRLIKISLDKEIYLPKFFKYYFESSKVKSFYSKKAQGTTMDVLNLSIIKTIPFPICPVEEQSFIINAN